MEDLNQKNDWDINPESYQQDEEGNFVLKKDGTPKKKAGRPKGKPSRGYNHHSETKAKIAARRSLRTKQKRLDSLEKKVKRARKVVRNQKEIQIKLDESPERETVKGKLITKEDLKVLPKATEKVVKDTKVIFQPNDGPQTSFLAAPEIDVLYGGAAGGGKSYAMLVDPLRYCSRSAHRALILRRSMPELRELIDKSRELYPRAFPGCKFREVEKLWNFPSGA